MKTEASPQISKVISKWPLASSLLSIGFGAVILASWAFRVPMLRTFIPGQVGIKANTGACFLLLGIALWLANTGSGRRWFSRWATYALAALVAIVGLISYFEYRFHWDAGIDQILFSAGPEDLPGSVGVGLMSPLAAVSFCLLATVIPLLDLRRRWAQSTVQILTACAAIVSMFGILDFVIEPTATYTHIGPPTALVQLLVSFGVMFSRADYGLSALLTSPGSGGKLLRRLVPASIAIPTLIVWLGWKGDLSGHYSTWTGLALTTVASTVLLALVASWTAVATNRAESTQLKASESSRWLAAVVNSSSEAIVGETLEGIISSWNAGAETIYGYSATETIGQPKTMLAPPERHAELEEFLVRIRRGEKIQHQETVRVRKDGQRIHVSLALSPVVDEHGAIIGVSTAARDVTERRRVEQALAASEQRYRSLVTATAQIVWTANARGEADDIPTWREFTGMTVDQVTGSGWLNAVHPEDRKRTEEDWARAWRDRKLYDTEYRIRRHDGDYRSFAVRGVPVTERDGTIREWVGICTDITERKQAEEKLQAERRRFESVLDNLPVMICLLTPDHDIRFANRTFQRVFGESAGRKCYELCFGKDAPCDFCQSYQALNGKAAHDWEVTIPNGRRVHTFDFPFTDTDGSPLILQMHVDITEQKQAEERLQEASRYVRSLIEASPDPLVMISPEGKITDVNEATVKVTGMERARLIGTDFSSYFTEPGKAQEGYRRVFEKGFVTDYPLTIRHQNGKLADVLYNASVYRDSVGKVLGVFAAARDVTALRHASQYARSLIEASVDPLVTISREGKITDVNQATENVTGVNREELIGSDFSNYFTEPEEARRGYEQVFAHGLVRDYPLAIRHISGWLTDVLYNASVFRNPQGEVEGVFAAARDVTDRKRAEEEVRRLNDELEDRVRQRTADLQAANKELEAFTYSVSHDLRAPLRHIGGFSKILTEELGPTLAENPRRQLQRIEEGTRRMGQMIDDLLTLGRVGRRDVNLQITGIKSLVEEVIADLQVDCADRQVEWDVGALPYLECDAALMRLVLQNLLSNALKFTRPRARSVIEVGQIEQNGVPVVYVRDNGVGFSMKYADKLFGVFQRLHRQEDFEGTGIGLATVQRIVHKHGGRIWAEAELGKGATFYFTLQNQVTREVTHQDELKGVPG